MVGSGVHRRTAQEYRHLSPQPWRYTVLVIWAMGDDPSREITNRASAAKMGAAQQRGAARQWGTEPLSDAVPPQGLAEGLLGFRRA